MVEMLKKSRKFWLIVGLGAAYAAAMISGDQTAIALVRALIGLVLGA